MTQDDGKKGDQEAKGKEEKKEYRSVSTRDILGNKNSRIGLLLLGLALFCAFASIYQVKDTFHDKRELKDHGVIELEQKRSSIESTLLLKFNPNKSSENPHESVDITISDFENDNSQTFTINDTETEIELDSEAYWFVYNLTNNEGEPKGQLSYHQKIVYNDSPYRFLTIPAFILTIVGIVMFYRGKFSAKKEKELEEEGRRERERMEAEKEKPPGEPEKERKEKPKEPRKQFMGVDWGDIDEGEEIERKDEEKK